MRSKRGDTTGHRDSGAVAVETAFVSMLLITILFGIVETSFLFKDSLSVSAAARAGARMGASQPRSATFAQDSADQVTNALSNLKTANLEQVWVYKTTGTSGKPIGFTDFSNCTDCVKYTWVAGSPGSLVQSYSNWSNVSQNACAGDSARDSLGVYVQYRHTSPVGFFFNNKILSESTVMWIEPIAANVVCKP